MKKLLTVLVISSIIAAQEQQSLLPVTIKNDNTGKFHVIYEKNGESVSKLLNKNEFITVDATARLSDYDAKSAKERYTLSVAEFLLGNGPNIDSSAVEVLVQNPWHAPFRVKVIQHLSSNATDTIPRHEYCMRTRDCSGYMPIAMYNPKKTKLDVSHIVQQAFKENINQIIAQIPAVEKFTDNFTEDVNNPSGKNIADLKKEIDIIRPALTAIEHAEKHIKYIIALGVVEADNVDLEMFKSQQLESKLSKLRTLIKQVTDDFDTKLSALKGKETELALLNEKKNHIKEDIEREKYAIHEELAYLESIKDDNNAKELKMDLDKLQTELGKIFLDTRLKRKEINLLRSLLNMVSIEEEERLQKVEQDRKNASEAERLAHDTLQVQRDLLKLQQQRERAAQISDFINAAAGVGRAAGAASSGLGSIFDTLVGGRRR